MKKTYLEPETKLYAMRVEGFLAGESNITAGTYNRPSTRW